MDIVDRVKKICLTPTTEWPVIAAESTPQATLITGYVLPLAAVSAVAGFIGGSIIGQTVPFFGGTYRVPLATGIGLMVFSIVMAVVGCYLISLIINALAPTFSAQPNTDQAFKIAVYSFTPAWVAGVFQILPALGILAVLGGLYAIYLLYLGLPRLMKCPEDKAIGYTVVVMICAIVVMFVLTMVGGMFIGAGMMGRGALGGMTGGGSTPAVEADPDSPMGRLQQLGESLEESARKMEAAEQSGDPGAQVSAALEGLGAVFGGGRRVDPVGIDELKPFVPGTLNGLPQTNSSAERTGMVGLMVSKAEATYSEGDREISLEVLDTGGASGLMAFATWMGVEMEREDDDGFERTRRVGDRMVHEESSRNGTSEFTVVLGQRFVVSARGRGVPVDELEDAVSDLDLDELESMADEGVQQ